MKLAIVFCVGCGGAGGIVSQDPDVEFLGTQCEASGSQAIIIDGNYGMTLAVGQAVAFDTEVIGEGTPSNENPNFGCRTWRAGNFGAENTSCIRDAGQPAQEVVDQNSLIEFPNDLLFPVQIRVTVTVTESQGSPTVLLTDQTTATCN